MNKFLPLFLFVFLVRQISAQDGTDSLVKALGNAKEDTSKAMLLNSLSWKLRNSKPESALRYGQEALALSEKLKFKKGICCALSYIGIANIKLSDYEEAIRNIKKAILLSEEMKDSMMLSLNYNNTGMAYRAKGEYGTAIECYIIALELADKKGDLKGAASTQNNIANVYSVMGNKKKALEYHQGALSVRQKLKDKRNIGVSMINIGIIYLELNSLDSALKYFSGAGQLFKEINDNVGMLGIYNGMAVVYYKKGNVDAAIRNYTDAIKLAREIGDEHAVSENLCNLSSILIEQGGAGNLNKAELYLQESLEIVLKIDSKVDLEFVYEQLSGLYEKKNDYKKAFTFHKLHSAIKDSVLNAENSKHINEMSAKYESEKKDKELIKNKADAQQLLMEAKQNSLQRNAFIVGFCLMVVLAVIIFRNNRIKQKANLLLEARNREINEKKEIIEEKQKEILDSIYYARRIQRALVTNEKNFSTLLKKCRAKFIF